MDDKYPQFFEIQCNAKLSSIVVSNSGESRVKTLIKIRTFSPETYLVSRFFSILINACIVKPKSIDMLNSGETRVKTVFKIWEFSSKLSTFSSNPNQFKVLIYPCVKFWRIATQNFVEYEGEVRHYIFSDPTSLLM